MKKIVPFCLLLILITFVGRVESQPSNYRIIVNSANDVTKLTKVQLSNIFLKKNTKWENGRKVVPVDLLENSSVREAFTKQIHGKPVSAIKSYWQQKIFSGRDVPPVELNSDEIVLSYVKSNVDAIGYVSGNAPIDKVKVVTISE